MHATYVRQGMSKGHPESGVWLFSRGRLDHAQLNITIDCDDVRHTFDSKCAPGSGPDQASVTDDLLPRKTPTLSPTESCTAMNITGAPFGLRGIYDRERVRGTTGATALRDRKSQWKRRKCSGWDDEKTKPGCKASRKTIAAQDVDGRLYWSDTASAWVLSGWDHVLVAGVSSTRQTATGVRPPTSSVWTIYELSRVLGHVTADVQWTVTITCLDEKPIENPPAAMRVEPPPENHDIIYIIVGVVAGLMLIGILWTLWDSVVDFMPCLDCGGKRQINKLNERLGRLEAADAEGTMGEKVGELEKGWRAAGQKLMVPGAANKDVEMQMARMRVEGEGGGQNTARASLTQEHSAMVQMGGDPNYPGGFSPDLPDIKSSILE